eukprot:CAMPEP_0194283404 /NCGR_PEP_ID=MMETSP0169-20130528/25292_1 /TAXON_ID=218684 /ORGANISM="Corethron pennatum, Strain L29A3" /LENGTH=149 /DNA_ID=CAMNT_0039028997 /DNA_START=123 /DNA_END=572 /DNA_ORIENTATION=+
MIRTLLVALSLLSPSAALTATASKVPYGTVDALLPLALQQAAADAPASPTARFPTFGSLLSAQDSPAAAACCPEYPACGCPKYGTLPPLPAQQDGPPTFGTLYAAQEMPPSFACCPDYPCCGCPKYGVLPMRSPNAGMIPTRRPLVVSH